VAISLAGAGFLRKWTAIPSLAEKSLCSNDPRFVATVTELIYPSPRRWIKKDSLLSPPPPVGGGTAGSVAPAAVTTTDACMFGCTLQKQVKDRPA